MPFWKNGLQTGKTPDTGTYLIILNDRDRGDYETGSDQLNPCCTLADTQTIASNGWN